MKEITILLLLLLSGCYFHVSIEGWEVVACSKYCGDPQLVDSMEIEEPNAQVWCVCVDGRKSSAAAVVKPAEK